MEQPTVEERAMVKLLMKREAPAEFSADVLATLIMTMETYVERGERPYFDPAGVLKILGNAGMDLARTRLGR